MKRYDPYYGNDGGRMEPHEYGDWVSYDEVEAMFEAFAVVIADPAIVRAAPETIRKLRSVLFPHGDQ